MEQQLASDPRVAIVIDTCDLTTGEVKQVRAQGVAELRPFDRARAYRKLSRYLGPTNDDGTPADSAWRPTPRPSS